MKFKPSEPRTLRVRLLTAWVWRILYGLTLTAMLASCSSLGKPEQQRSPVAPDCSQRAPAIDSGDPPAAADLYDWRAWAQAFVTAQYAVVDRDNKRAATADCLDHIAEVKL